METAIERGIAAWLGDPAIADADKEEVRTLQARGAEQELADRFYRQLQFGTGGLRGIMGAGLNRMNIYTVGAAAQGLARYLLRQDGAEPSAVVAFDSRHNSDRFARRTACVLAGNGVRVHLFESLRPTPELSFAVRHLGATAGVVVTASHNPPEYNGFKVYWSDGVQIVPPHDERIIEEVRQVREFGDVQAAEFEEAHARGMIRTISREVDEPFLQAVQDSCLIPDLCRTYGKSLKLVYTALHGSGGVLIPQALTRRGFRHVLEVPEQRQPDGRFPTVASPNPEEAAALNLGIELARREGGDLVIGTDPDADRVGLAVRDGQGGYELVNGNRIAGLITFFVCEVLKSSGRLPRNGVLVTTIVSGDMMKDIARSYGVEVVETLTGFKWIGQRVCEYEKQGPGAKVYVFGGEESYGYMPATYTRDKDAVTSAAYIADAACWAASRGQTLYQLLETLFHRYGYYEEGARSVSFTGPEGAQRMGDIMEGLRRDPPASIGALEVEMVADMMTGLGRRRADGAIVRRYDLPQSNVLIFVLADGTKAIIRPSGTEPKIKLYVLVREPAVDIEQAQRSAQSKMASVMNDLAEHGLQARC